MKNSFVFTANISPKAAIMKSGSLRVHGYAYSEKVNPKTGKPNCREIDLYINHNQKWLVNNMHEGDLYQFAGYITTRQVQLNKMVEGVNTPYNYNMVEFVATVVIPLQTKTDRPLVEWKDLRAPVVAPAPAASTYTPPAKPVEAEVEAEAVLAYDLPF